MLRISGNFAAQKLIMQAPLARTESKPANPSAGDVSAADLGKTKDDAGVAASNLDFRVGAIKNKNASSGGKVTVNGETLSVGTKADWNALGITDEMLEQYFITNGKSDTAKYSLKTPYTGITSTGSGGSFNMFTGDRISWTTFTVTTSDENHTQEVKVYSDGTMKTVDKQVTTYEKNLKNGAYSTFSKDDLTKLGINDEMIEKYFNVNGNDYALKSPYTSFDVVKLSGDTDSTGEIVFKRGNQRALSDTYQLKDGQASSKFSPENITMINYKNTVMQNPKTNIKK